MFFEKTMNGEKKFTQLSNLVDWMSSSSEGLTLEDIKNRYGISLRTAQRWLGEIRELYGHMEKFSIDGRKLRWKLSNRDLNRKFSLSAQELSILNISADLLKKHNLRAQADELIALETKLKGIIKQAKQRQRIEE